MKAYLELLRDILENGETHDDRTGVGTLSVFGRQVRFDLRNGFPLMTTKKLPLRWIAEELFWFLSGSTNERDLAARGVDIWSEWATKEQCAKFGRREGNLGHVYGSLWRDFLDVNTCHDIGGIPHGYIDPDSRPGKKLFGNDQIAALLHDLEHNPQSRRLIVSGWHPVEQRRVALPPCHTLWQCKVHGAQSHYEQDGAEMKLRHSVEEISLHLYARSIDSFLGLPFNIASYALLLSLLSHVTNREPRDLIISFGDVHIYRNHIDQVNKQLAREPRSLPQLTINDRIRGKGFDGVTQCTWSDIDLHGYDPHPKIIAEVAV